jgi:hypothetical protein
MSEEKRDIFGALIPIDDSADNLPANFAAELETGLSNLALGVAGAGSIGGLPFLGISRGGSWQYGQDNVRVDPEGQAGIDVRTLKHGWISWGEGTVLGEVLVSVFEPLPTPSDLPSTGADWARCYSVEMIFIGGKDDGVKVLYKGNSNGCRKAFAALGASIQRQRLSDPAKIFPVVRLRTSSWQSRKYGEIFEPVLEIVRWIDPRGGPRAQSAPVAAAPKQAPLADAAVDDVLPAAKPADAGRRRRVGA